jgi:signal transduction histidine kinase
MRWPVTRTLVLLAFGLDLFFSVLVTIGYFYLIGIDGELGWQLALLLLTPPMLAKSAAILFVFPRMLRPIDRWIRAEGTSAQADELTLRAADAVYTVGDRFSSLVATLWGMTYPFIAAAAAVLRPPSASVGWKGLIATILVTVSVTSAALVLSRTIIDALLFSTAGRISLTARAHSLPLPTRLVSLPSRLALFVILVAAAPTTWIASLAYTALARAGGSAHLIAFFALVSTVWIPLAALFVASAIARPLASVAKVIGAISTQQDASNVERIPIYSRDDIGHLAEDVNHMIDRLAKSAEEELALDQFKDQFIHVAAHELNTPVAIVKACGEILIGAADALPPSRQPVPAALLRGAERMERIVHDLLSISQLQLGRLPFAKERVDLRALADRAVASVAPMAPRHQLQVVGERALAVKGDAARLEEVIRNLLDNAIKYSPAGGNVNMSIQREAGRAVLSVRDEGIGIAVAKQPRIFERFYRAHTDTPYDRGGLGVGLYVSREFVRLHGGKMWFDSKEGKGSTFYLSLDAAVE